MDTPLVPGVSNEEERWGSPIEDVLSEEIPLDSIAAATLTVTTSTPDPLSQIMCLLEMAQVDTAIVHGKRQRSDKGHSAVYGVARVLIERGRLYQAGSMWDTMYHKFRLLLHGEDTDERLRDYGVDVEQHHRDKEEGGPFYRFVQQQERYRQAAAWKRDRTDLLLDLMVRMEKAARSKRSVPALRAALREFAKEAEALTSPNISYEVEES